MTTAIKFTVPAGHKPGACAAEVNSKPGVVTMKSLRQRRQENRSEQPCSVRWLCNMTTGQLEQLAARCASTEIRSLALEILATRNVH